jgi:hypothetical protein
MREEAFNAAQTDYTGSEKPSYDNSSATAGCARTWPMGIMFCTLGFVVSILLTVTPLTRMPERLLRLSLPLGNKLGTVSSWFPTNLGSTYQPSSASIEFFCLLALAFLCYLLGALFVRRAGAEQQQSRVRTWVWCGAILVGAIYLVTPALLSHDMMVYAGYSRLLAAHHANPYFVPLSAFPGDPIAAVDQWAGVISAYGPIWMLICGMFGALLPASPLAYVLAFRLFALTMHLLNTWLIGRTLVTMGRASRTVTLGMLLYAWNPLVLLESSLNGHNDVLMVTFVLLALLLMVRAEKGGQLLRARGYLPPAITLTMAVLVKFTALPILAMYLLFLVCKALRPMANSSEKLKLALHNWRAAIAPPGWSCAAMILVVLAFYGPFWLGHTSDEIIWSFKNTPSSGMVQNVIHPILSENSFMRSVINWLKFHPEQSQNAWLTFLSKRPVWDTFNFIALLCCFALGALHLLRKPMSQTFLTLALAAMYLLLLITPWFFPWYLTWLVALAAVCLPPRQERVAWSLLLLTLTFSFSALTYYLFNSGLLGSRGYLVSFFDTFPPLCTLLIYWIIHTCTKLSTGSKEL